MRFYYLLIIILIIIIALILIYYLMPVIKKLGGADDLDYIILDEIKELIDVSLSGVISHLEKHFKIRESGRGNNTQYLLKLINAVIDKYNVNNHEDFIAISALSQKAVLPHDKACLLCKRTFKIRKKDITKVKRLLNDYLIRYEMYWDDDKVEQHATDLLTANRIYKFSDNMLELTPSKLKKALDKKNDTMKENIIEVDIFAMKPIVRDYVRSHKYMEKIINSKKRKRELQLIKDALLTSRRYPRHKIRDISTFRDLIKLLSGQLI